MPPITYNLGSCANPRSNRFYLRGRTVLATFWRTMSDQQRKIYQSEGDRYEALIAREDFQGNIPRAIDEIINADDLDVLDLGAGTGRLTLLLAPRARSIRAFDVSAEMLRVCRQRLTASGLSNWQVDVADHRQIPVQDHSADLVVSGWSVSYLAVWNPENAQIELDKWIEFCVIRILCSCRNWRGSFSRTEHKYMSVMRTTTVNYLKASLPLFRARHICTYIIHSINKRK